MKYQKEVCALLFSDIKGYSKLNEHQFSVLATAAFPRMAEIVRKDALLYVNTWGDAVVAAYRDPLSAAEAAIELRDFFSNTNWTSQHLPKDLNIRVALHAGVIFLGDDPIKGGSGLIGTQVNLAARIEPITKAGQVWATSQFKALLDQCPDEKLVTDDLGERPLAKQWGSEKLYRVRRPTDSAGPVDTEEEPASKKFDGVDAALRILKHSTSDDQIAMALELLGETKESRAVPPLLEILKDKTKSVRLRNRAAASLGNLHLSTAIPDMLDVLTDEDDDLDLRDTVVVALGELGDVRAGDVLLRILNDKMPMPRKTKARAILALGKIGDPKYVPEVMALAKQDQEELVSTAIIDFANKLKDIRCVDALLQIAADKEHHVEVTRGAAVQIAVRIAPDLAVDRLIQIVDDPQEIHDIQLVALRGLARVNSPKAQQKLKEIGSDPVHPHAVMALAFLMNPDKYVREKD